MIKSLTVVLLLGALVSAVPVSIDASSSSPETVAEDDISTPSGEVIVLYELADGDGAADYTLPSRFVAQEENPRTNLPEAGQVLQDVEGLMPRKAANSAVHQQQYYNYAVD